MPACNACQLHGSKLAECAAVCAGLPVVVYSGQLDLICCTLGVDAWLDKLQWDGMQQFQAGKLVPKHTADRPHLTTRFVKSHKNLMLQLVLNAGHMVPADQPQTALEMIASIMDSSSEQVLQ